MIRNTIKRIFPSNRNEVSSNENGNKLFFVHIPKTAGSSFRTAFENVEHTYKDYGKGSKSTSNEVQLYAYGNNDLYTLKTIFCDNQDAWITGHVNLSKYINFVPVTNTITFVRKPLDQILSHYNHYVKHHGYDGDLADFLDKPLSKNLQSRNLNFMPLGLIGCVGLTEFYDQSLDIINQQYNLKLEVKKVNVNKTKHFKKSTLDEKLNDKFIKNNKLDLAMYEEAEFLHLQRLSLLKRNQPWTYGFAEINQHGALYGCAFQLNYDGPISLSIYLNGVIWKELTAKGFFNGFPKANFPRDRYVGFHLPLQSKVLKEDKVEVYVKGTGQQLTYRPLTIKK